ncbi:MAG: glycosyltransferase family 4 protein [Clostridiales bacterium]|nr:glycosyltransferase family 4 protein [Clostridiales bacterium]
MKRKAIIIQNYLSPYRVPLFAAIAASESFDLTVALMAPNKPSYPMWKYEFSQLPFRVKSIPGIRLVLPSQEKPQICLNPYLLKFLNEEKPAVIFCSGFNPSSIIAALYRLLTGTPIVIWSESTSITENIRSFSFVRKTIRKFIAALSSGFVIAGQAARDYILSLLPKNSKKPIIISYNCVDSDWLSSACQRFKEDPAAWSRFRSVYPKKNILFSGRLIEPKGIRPMLEVYKKVIEESPDEVGLILLGQGKLKEFIQNYKHKYKLRNVFIEGFIGPDQYPKYFALADVFLLLSLWDCNPLVIFEALSCGLPIICSNRAGNAVDFIKEDQNGYIVDPFDIKGTANKVLNLLYSQKIEEMRSVSREIVRKANYQDSAAAFVRIAKRILS